MDVLTRLLGKLPVGKKVTADDKSLFLSDRENMSTPTRKSLFSFSSASALQEDASHLEVSVEMTSHLLRWSKCLTSSKLLILTSALKCCWNCQFFTKNLIVLQTNTAFSVYLINVLRDLQDGIFRMFALVFSSSRCFPDFGMATFLLILSAGMDSISLSSIPVAPPTPILADQFNLFVLLFCVSTHLNALERLMLAFQRSPVFLHSRDMNPLNLILMTDSTVLNIVNLFRPVKTREDISIVQQCYADARVPAFRSSPGSTWWWFSKKSRWSCGTWGQEVCSERWPRASLLSLHWYEQTPTFHLSDSVGNAAFSWPSGICDCKTAATVVVLGFA